MGSTEPRRGTRGVVQKAWYKRRGIKSVVQGAWYKKRGTRGVVKRKSLEALGARHRKPQLVRHPERSEGSVVNGQILRRLPLADSSE
jgi:hypothetical protein